MTSLSFLSSTYQLILDDVALIQDEIPPVDRLHQHVAEGLILDHFIGGETYVILVDIREVFLGLSATFLKIPSHHNLQLW